MADQHPDSTTVDAANNQEQAVTPSRNSGTARRIAVIEEEFRKLTESLERQRDRQHNNIRSHVEALAFNRLIYSEIGHLFAMEELRPLLTGESYFFNPFEPCLPHADNPNYISHQAEPLLSSVRGSPDTPDSVPTGAEGDEPGAKADSPPTAGILASATTSCQAPVMVPAAAADDTSTASAVTSPSSSSFLSAQSTSSPSTSHEKCVVCSQQATGKHYGVYSCEGCKGFFRRSVRNKLTYACREEGNCQLVKTQRKRCKSCRLQKCLQQGMRREAVWEDHITVVERREMELELKHRRSDDWNMVGRLNQIRSAEMDTGFFQVENNPLPLQLEELLPELARAFSLHYERVPLYAAKLPYFMELADKDRRIMLDSAWISLMILQVAYRSADYSDNESLLLCTGRLLNMKTVQHDETLRSLVASALILAVKMKIYQVDFTLYSVIRAMALFFSSVYGITEDSRVLIDSLSGKISQSFVKSSNSRSGNSSISSSSSAVNNGCEQQINSRVVTADDNQSDGELSSASNTDSSDDDDADEEMEIGNEAVNVTGLTEERAMNGGDVATKTCSDVIVKQEIIQNGFQKSVNQVEDGGVTNGFKQAYGGELQSNRFGQLQTLEDSQQVVTHAQQCDVDMVNVAERHHVKHVWNGQQLDEFSGHGNGNGKAVGQSEKRKRKKKRVTAETTEKKAKKSKNSLPPQGMNGSKKEAETDDGRTSKNDDNVDDRAESFDIGKFTFICVDLIGSARKLGFRCVQYLRNLVAGNGATQSTWLLDHSFVVGCINRFDLFPTIDDMMIGDEYDDYKQSLEEEEGDGMGEDGAENCIDDSCTCS